MIYTKPLAIVVAYDIYTECAGGGLESELEIEDPLEFWTFRDVLSKQILQ